LRDNEILLAMKKRSFGEGKWNGTGGKVQGDESVEQAVIRETSEEIGVVIAEADLEKVAILTFHWPSKPEWNQQCHVFVTRVWGNEPAESEEMRPQWFAYTDIPYDSMWPDDILWLPLVLEGKHISADFTFSEGGEGFDSYEIREVV